VELNRRAGQNPPRVVAPTEEEEEEISVVELYIKYRYLKLSTLICPLEKPVHDRKLQEGQCTYNVILSSVRATIVAVE